MPLDSSTIQSLYNPRPLLSVASRDFSLIFGCWRCGRRRREKILIFMKCEVVLLDNVVAGSNIV
jgi:hypothetical protein